MDEFLKFSNLDLANYSVPTLVDFIFGYVVALVASTIIALSLITTLLTIQKYYFNLCLILNISFRKGFFLIFSASCQFKSL